MDLIVLPRVSLDSTARDALAAMKASCRSAVLAEGQKGTDSGVWLFDLATLLAGIRERRKRLSEITGGVPVVTASDRRLQAMHRRSDSEGALRGAIQSNLDRLGFAAMRFLDEDEAAGQVGGQVRRSVLNLATGLRNPSGLISTALLVTPKGTFVERFASLLRLPGQPEVRLAVIATDSERRAGLYEVDPTWCTCNLDQDHMYPHSQHNTGDACPQYDGGKLKCG